MLLVAVFALVGLVIGSGLDVHAAEVISSLTGGFDLPSFSLPVATAGMFAMPMMLNPDPAGEGGGGGEGTVTRKQLKDMIDNFNAKNAEIEKAQTDLIEKMDKLGGESPEVKALTEKMKQLEENIIKAQDIIIKQGEFMSGINLEAVKNDVKVVTLRGAIAKALKADGVAESIKAFKAGERKSFDFDLDLKATIDIANVANNEYAQEDPEIGKQPVRRFVMESLFTRRPVDADNNGGTIRYTEQNVLTRNAGTVIRCNALPESDITWDTKKCDIEKIGDSIKICIDGMEDIAWLEGEVRDFITENVQLEYDLQLLLGDGISPNLKGVDSVAPDWAAGTHALNVPNPNIFDVAKVGIGAISNAGQNNAYQANWILMNNDDWTEACYVKDQNDNYIIPPFVDMDGFTIGGAGIIITPLVPANEMYIGDFTKGKVYNHRALNVQIADMNEDDFDKDLVTLKATRRDALVIKDVHNGAFLHVPDIAAAITALTKP